MNFVKQKNDYILLIMNCEKYRWKADLQSNGWLKNVEMKYFHVLGNEQLGQNYIFDHEQKILWLNTKDDYNSLPLKVISAYQAVYETFDFKYLFKTDDDQTFLLPDFNIFSNLVTNLAEQKKANYGGYIIQVNFPYVSKYNKIHPELPSDIIVQKTTYCSGRFYFLSHLAISNLISKREEIAKEYFEDYAIGYYLDEKYKENILRIDSGKYFQDIQNNVI